MGNHKLEISASLGRILESSKRKDGLAAVSEFLSTMDAQVKRIFTKESMCALVKALPQASQQLITDMRALHGDLSRVEQALLSNIPTSTVVDELCELA